MDARPVDPSPGAKSAASRRLLAFLVALCACVAVPSLVWNSWDAFGPRHRPLIQGWDDSFYYFWLPAVVINHDLDFSSQIERSATVDEAARAEMLRLDRTQTGLIPNKYPPGWAIGSLPFFLAAHAFSQRGATGLEPGYFASVWLGQLLYAAAGLALAAAVVRRLVPAAPAGAAVLSVWLASPLVYYQVARVSLSHSQLFVLAMAVFWLALRLADGDRRRRVWFALGFCSALLVVTRNIDAVYLLFPAVLLARSLRRGVDAAWLAIGAALPAAMQVAAWKILFGSWFAYSYYTERFVFGHTHYAGLLFSPRHGWFYWHPLLLVGIIGFLAWSRPRPVAWPFVVSLAAIIALNGAWPNWWFASSFGSRGFEVATFFCMLGVASLFARVRDRPLPRRILAGCVALAITWNILLLALFLTRRISREESVTYADAARALGSWLAVRP
jgi:hypothetical protein